jgi:hypothetical protein
LTPLPKDAELVAFGICQYDPCHVALADVDTLRAMSNQASHLSVLVIRPEVEVQAALGVLAFIKPNEVQPRQPIGLGADLELISRDVDHDPTKSLGPPLPEADRVYRVNKYLFPLQRHAASVGGRHRAVDRVRHRPQRTGGAAALRQFDAGPDAKPVAALRSAGAASRGRYDRLSPLQVLQKR